MKLCQRCNEAIKQATGLEIVHGQWMGEETRFTTVFFNTVETVPESGCEFWAHKERNVALRWFELEAGAAPGEFEGLYQKSLVDEYYGPEIANAQAKVEAKR